MLRLSQDIEHVKIYYNDNISVKCLQLPESSRHEFEHLSFVFFMSLQIVLQRIRSFFVFEIES